MRVNWNIVINALFILMGVVLAVAIAWLWFGEYLYSQFFGPVWPFVYGR